METAQNVYIQSELADELRLEGIYCRGYGTVPKAAMLDKDLTIEAKSIYAYFCSYSGTGNSIFPGRDKILADLCMSKDSYYRHYKLLTEAGYIIVKQKKTPGCQFQNNVYTLVSCPEKFKDLPKDSSLSKNYATIKLSGLKGTGYGLVPKALMTDKRISVKAKGLYSYYAAFTGGGESSFPEKSIAMAHLGIGIHAYEKLNKELLKFNYIVVKQRHVNGRLSVNDVYLVDNPDMKQGTIKHIIEKYEKVPIKQSSNIQDTGEYLQSYKKQDTEKSKKNLQYYRKQDTEIQYTEKQDSEIQDTNNNKLKQKQKFFIINNSINPAEQKRLDEFHEIKIQFLKLLGREKDIKIYSDEQKHYQDFVINEMFKNGTIPYEWLSNRKVTKAMVEVLTDDYTLGCKKTHLQFENGEFQWKVFCMYRDTLINMLTCTRKMNLDGSMVSADDVYEKFVETAEINPEHLVLNLRDLYNQVRDSYYFAAQTYDIKNPTSYIRTCIWNALQAGDLKNESALIKLDKEIRDKDRWNRFQL